MATKANQYREAYFTLNPETVLAYLDMLYSIDPDGVMVNREGKVWIEFSDGSEWQLGSAEKPASDMNHHDA